MVLNIFSLTIAITKREREISLEKVIHDENAKKIFEENRRKLENYARHRQY
ncbi:MULTISPECIES: YrzI family small protein [Solibacillus]|uniref:YrzI family small protein n=1 Tax=Solibacillus merdavium TaxID=2762218 RepID=A0ABR8XMG1_9BACL|nr:YrzI family small protein [Solibacillus merdavium]MBD8033120.1 YrzI family small protein [Solibacillus merdavium]